MDFSLSKESNRVKVMMRDYLYKEIELSLALYPIHLTLFLFNYENEIIELDKNPELQSFVM